MISFEDFSKDLLAPWSGELPADGDVGDPRTAAMKAAFDASITHTKKRGTVLVICDDAAGARSCSDYLKSFFSDQPQLALLAKKISSDEVVLHHGPKIVVTTDKTRRPRDLLSTIRLVTGSDVVTDVLKTDAELARDIAHILLIEGHAATPDPIAIDLVRSIFGLRSDEEALERLRSFGESDGRDAMRWDELKAAQKGLHRGSSLEVFQQFDAGKTSVPQIPRRAAPTSPVGPDGYYTCEYEQARMERVTQRGGMQQTRPIKWRRN